MGLVRDCDSNRLLILIIFKLEQLHCHMDCWNCTVIEKSEIPRTVLAQIVVDSGLGSRPSFVVACVIASASRAILVLSREPSTDTIRDTMEITTAIQGIINDPSE